MDLLASKLTSRKFLLALAAFLNAVQSGEPVLAAAIAAVYVLAEAAVDHKSA